MISALAGLLLQLHTVDPHNGTVALGRWLFHQGDDARWALPDADEQGWATVAVPGAWAPPAPPGYRGYGWDRLHQSIPRPLGQPLGPLVPSGVTRCNAD